MGCLQMRKAAIAELPESGCNTDLAVQPSTKAFPIARWPVPCVLAEMPLATTVIVAGAWRRIGPWRTASKEVRLQ